MPSRRKSNVYRSNLMCRPRISKSQLKCHAMHAYEYLGKTELNNLCSHPTVCGAAAVQRRNEHSRRASERERKSADFWGFFGKPSVSIEPVFCSRVQSRGNEGIIKRRQGYGHRRPSPPLKVIFGCCQPKTGAPPCLEAIVHIDSRPKGKGHAEDLRLVGPQGKHGFGDFFNDTSPSFLGAVV